MNTTSPLGTRLLQLRTCITTIEHITIAVHMEMLHPIMTTVISPVIHIMDTTTATLWNLADRTMRLILMAENILLMGIQKTLMMLLMIIHQFKCFLWIMSALVLDIVLSYLSDCPICEFQQDSE